MRRLGLGFLLVLALAAVSGAARAPAAERPAMPVAAPVASLDPAATDRLWQKLVATSTAREARTAQTACRPLRAVFYSATDYLRLATKLAATTSPCADYYISVPPLVADKTKPRPGAADKIRALGPNFHAMAEFHFTTWSKWVASTGSSWYVAGTTARERMAAAGYDFSKGDTWVLNEISSAVRTNTGQARTNVRELLRCLYEGDGTRPTRGAVFITGLGQQTNSLGQYQTNLQNWLSDSGFWADMSTYVSDWSQEVYGDVRNWAVPGADTATRRDALNDYLQHALVLADAGPPTIDPARTFLDATFSPLANAAWERDTAYGWTAVPAAQMAAYVSAEVYSLRYFSSATGQAADHWGFAWAPRNGSGSTPADFAAQTDQILTRLAAAIRDSGQDDPEDPGSAACVVKGTNFCVGDLDGARLNAAWQTFRAWTQPLLSFATPPQTIQAGSTTAAMRLTLLSNAGQPQTALAPLAVTLSSTSPAGRFSTTPTGPWTPTLALTIAAGSGTSPDFYYLDTRAGPQLLTAAATGVTSGAQTVTVLPGAALSLAVTPKSARLRTRSTLSFTAIGKDTYGNAVPVSAAWSVSPSTYGTVSPRTGPTTTLTTLRATGQASVTATAGGLSGGAVVRVNPSTVRIAAITYRPRSKAARLPVRAVDTTARPVSNAAVSLVVRLGTRRAFTGRATTGAAGKATLRVPVGSAGCLRATIRSVSAPGFVWNGRTPANRYCAP
jgi:enamine deaminase RidA (YjgF/YER057c/UK114 family)